MFIGPPFKNRLSTDPVQVPDHEMIKLIGRGSYGEVWLARNVMGTYRAIKIVRRDAFDHERPYEREYEGIRKFEPISRSHDSQIDILHVGRNESSFYYVMELADDSSSEPNKSVDIDVEHYSPKTLKSELNRRGSLPVEECVEIGLALTTALSHLHKYGLVHRDIKPSNIIYRNSLPKLADIGLVCTFDATLSYVGTIGFTPPEGPGSPKADIYSLGKVLYEAATARDRQDFPELPTQLSGTFGSQSSLIELNEVLLKACESDPRHRYQSADEMHEDLLLLRSGKSLVRLRTAERRFLLARRMGVAAIVIGIVAGLAYLYQARQTTLVKKLATENLHLAKRAEISAQANRDQLVQLQVSKGTELWNKTDLSGALSWFGAALANVTNAPRANALHRTRVQSLLDNHPKLLHLFVHEGVVYRTAFTPDGLSLVTHSEGDIIKVFDLRTEQLRFSLVGSNGSMAYQPWGPYYAPALIFSSDGDRLINRGLMPRVNTEIFDLKQGRQIFLPESVYGVNSRILDSTDGEKALVQTSPTTVQFFALDSGAPLSAELRASGEIITGRLSQHNSRAALHFRRTSQKIDQKNSVGEEAKLQVWDLESGNELGPPMISTDVRSDSRFLLMQEGAQLLLINNWGEENAMRIFNAETGVPLGSAVTKGRPILLNPVSGQWAVFDLGKAGRKLQNLENDESISIDDDGNIRSIGLSQDGLLLATATDYGMARVWNRNTGGEVLAAMHHATWCYGAEFSPDDTYLATCSQDRTVRVWDLTASSQSKASFDLDGAASAAAFSPDGTSAAVADGANSSIHVWSSRPGQAMPPTPLTSGLKVSQLSFSPDGTMLLATGDTVSAPMRGAVLWHMGAGESWKSNCLWLHRSAVIRHADFSSDSTRIATAGGQDKKACIWNAATGELMLTLEQTAIVTTVRFNRTGTELITLCETSPGVGAATIKFWNSRTGAMIRELKSNRGYNTLDVSTDGNFLVAGDMDQCAHVWDLQKGQESIKPLWEGGNPVQVKLSPGGNFLVTYGLAAPKIWNLGEWPIRSRSIIGRNTLASDANQTVDISGEGRLVLSMDRDTLRLWDAATAEQMWAAPWYSAEITTANFNPVTGEILTGDTDHKIKIWKPGECGYSPDNVSRIADVLACHLFQTDSPLLAEEMGEIYQSLRKAHPEAFRTTPPERVTWHEKMARLARSAHRPECEIFHIDAAIEIDPTLASRPEGSVLLSRRGDLNANLGNLEAATADYKRSVQLNPDHIKSWQRLLSSLLARNLAKGWADTYAKLFSHFSWVSNIQSINVRDWKIRLGELASSGPPLLSNYDQLIHLMDGLMEDSDPMLFAMRGRLLFRAGRMGEAISDFNHVIAAQSDSSGHRAVDLFFLAMSYQRTGRKEEAHAIFERACLNIKENTDKSGDHPDWEAATLWNAARKEAENVLQIH